MRRSQFLSLFALATAFEFQEEQGNLTIHRTSGVQLPPRGGHCAFLVQQQLYVYGGCALPGPHCYNDVHALSTSTMSWERVAVQNLPPHPAAGIACAASGPNLAVVGGYTGSYAGAAPASVFDADSLSWHRLDPAGDAPKARQGATLTPIAAGMSLLFGGADDKQHFNDVHVLEYHVGGSATERWRKIDASCSPQPCANPPGRDGHSAALVGRKLWIFGGASPLTRRRTRHPHATSLTRPARALAGIGKVGSTYVALQGLRYLDTTTFVWHDPTAQINGVEHAPSARYGAAAVVLGSRLLLAGGMASALPHAPNHANHSVGGHPPPGVAAVGAGGAGGATSGLVYTSDAADD